MESGEHVGNIPVAVRVDRDSGMDDVRVLRRAFRRVFDPGPDEVSSPQDREAVMRELRAICFYDTSFDVAMGSSDVGYQIAGMEGSRRVYLKIVDAIRMSKGDDLKVNLPSEIAKVG